MAEQKPTNQLVERLVRILSKSDDGAYIFSEIGKIYVPSFTIGEDETLNHNVFVYDPSDIRSFLDAYEEAFESVGANNVLRYAHKGFRKNGRHEWQIKHGVSE
jgi:hypothetical protein